MGGFVSPTLEGLPSVGYTAFDATFYDAYGPEGFIGAATYGGAGFARVVGVSGMFINLGSATTRLTAGREFGYEAGVEFVSGSSYVTWRERWNCERSFVPTKIP